MEEKNVCTGCNQVINRPTKFFEYCETAQKIVRIKKELKEEIEHVKNKIGYY